MSQGGSGVGVAVGVGMLACTEQAAENSSRAAKRRLILIPHS